MSWQEIVASVLLCLGALLTLTGGVGILRLPDFYARLHPAGKSDTMGQALIVFGLLFLVDWPGDWLVGAKLVFITILLFVTAPTATHAITRAAWLDGLTPFTKDGSAERHRATDTMRRRGIDGSDDEPGGSGERRSDADG